MTRDRLSLFHVLSENNPRRRNMSNSHKSELEAAILAGLISPEDCIEQQRKNAEFPMMCARWYGYCNYHDQIIFRETDGSCPRCSSILCDEDVTEEEILEISVAKKFAERYFLPSAVTKYAEAAYALDINPLPELRKKFPEFHFRCIEGKMHISL
jgi:hypothetical protein